MISLNIIANILGYREMKMYEATEEQRQNVFQILKDNWREKDMKQSKLAILFISFFIFFIFPKSAYAYYYKIEKYKVDINVNENNFLM